MNIPQGICTKCGSDFFQCHCDQFHPNIEPKIDNDYIIKFLQSLVKEWEKNEKDIADFGIQAYTYGKCADKLKFLLKRI